MNRICKRILVAGAVVACLAAVSIAGTAKDKETDGKVWDSGSFGIFVNGKRVGTEKFTIEQRSTHESVADSEITVDDGHAKVTQTAEMRVAPNGDLISYVWKGLSPRKEQSTVEPKDQLLVEHVMPADQKKMDVPYVLPLSTVILDDNFFSHRELLVWRYLATGCVVKPNEGRMCAPTHFGILVPHQHTSASAVMELTGREQINVKGKQQELNKFKIESDGVVWNLWVSDDYKVIKMAVPSSNVEVVRD
ncbi:MAG TPA: hypothetical protein VFP59_11080 [Candidatus Angelobacter sp.]|nr:hypothetical protein [Candidatus Angelobacter sp.]